MRSSKRVALSPPEGEKLDPDRFVFFWGHTSDDDYCFFSNWSEYPVWADDFIFPTAEHFLMHSKAMMMGDTAAALAIMKAKTPKEAKALGRRVKNFNEKLWNSKREEVMVDGLKRKIAWTTSIHGSLQSTGDRIIAEASPYDRIWGIGISKDNPRALYMSAWPGTNLLGKAWMRVRDELRLRVR